MNARPLHLLVPFGVAFILFWAVPLINAFMLSMESGGFYGKSQFAGLTNYGDLFQDGRFFKALSNTLVFALSSIAIIIPLALGLALCLKRCYRPLRNLLSFGLILPGLTPPSVLALLFLLIFNGKYGILNDWILDPLTGRSIDWIKDPAWIKPSLVLQEVWRWTGFMVFFTLASLESIPDNWYRIASAEGAGHWKKFTTITWPSVRGTLLYLSFFLLLDAFVLFEGAYVLLGNSGGTADAGLLTVSYIYHTAFSTGNFGYSASMSFFLIPLFMAAGFLLWWFRNRTLQIKTSGRRQG